jgi:hypothetical protein
VRRHVADMAMFDLRAHPLHAARGFVLVPPDERGCRKTYGIGVKRTQILGMGCSTLKLDLWQGSLTCRRNGRTLLANSEVPRFVCPTYLLGRQKSLGNLRKKKYC